MNRKEIDIKNCDNIDEPFSFEKAIKTYKYLKESHCEKWKIKIKFQTYDFWRYIGNDIKCIFRNELENEWLLFQAFGRGEEEHLLRVEIAGPISLEKVIKIWEKLIQLLDFNAEGIEYDPQKKYVISNLVKK